MRLWSLHPKYLDPQGLVALWREALLARAVLSGNTRGYRNHPQLERFRNSTHPLAAIDAYLRGIHAESRERGYTFDASKIDPVRAEVSLSVTAGQVQYEWHHLLHKLSVRNPALHQNWQAIGAPGCHPLFQLCPGPIAAWERVSNGAGL